MRVITLLSGEREQGEGHSGVNTTAKTLQVFGSIFTTAMGEEEEEEKEEMV